MLLPTVVTQKDLSQVLKKARSFQASMNPKCQCSVCKRPLNFDDLALCTSQNIPFACSVHLPKLIAKRLHTFKAHIAKNLSTFLTSAGVPPRFLDCSFSNFHCPPGNPTVLKACYVTTQSSSQNTSHGIFLRGTNGTGKTHLAISILRATLLRGIVNCHFIKIPHLLFQVKKAFKSTSFDTEDLLIQRFLKYDLLVLDELGVEKATPWTLQTLYLIIDGRSSHLKKTVFTSNLTLQDIEDNIDARFASRIVEMCTLLDVAGGDYRISSKQNKLKGGSNA